MNRLECETQNNDIKKIQKEKNKSAIPKTGDVCVCGFRAYVEKYLLEKSRLVYQEHNER